jgi:hypothetical protein
MGGVHGLGGRMEGFIGWLKDFGIFLGLLSIVTGVVLGTTLAIVLGFIA